MIVFRDMTFCPFLECSAKGCTRRLTDNIREIADEWWGKGKGKAPICQFVNKPECYEEDTNV